MTIDHIAIPRTPTQKYQVSNNHKSFSALNPACFMTRLQKLLMIHRERGPNHLQAQHRRFPNQVSHITRKYLRNYATKFTHLPSQVVTHNNGLKFPNEAVEKQQNKCCASGGARTNHQLQDRHAQHCSSSSSESRSLPMSYTMPS